MVAVTLTAAESRLKVTTAKTQGTLLLTTHVPPMRPQPPMTIPTLSESPPQVEWHPVADHSDRVIQSSPTSVSSRVSKATSLCSRSFWAEWARGRTGRWSSHPRVALSLLHYVVKITLRLSLPHSLSSFCFCSSLGFALLNTGGRHKRHNSDSSPALSQTGCRFDPLPALSPCQSAACPVPELSLVRLITSFNYGQFLLFCSPPGVVQSS